MTTSKSLPTGQQPRTFTSTWDASEQPYNLFVPMAHGEDNPRPLVIALHGKTATWESWFENTAVCQWAERESWVVATPHGRGDWFYLGPGERDVLDVIADVKRLCAIDEERVHLIGHSMGGWGTWHLSCAHPDLFAAIVPMAGWAPVELLGNVRHLTPLVIHGDADIPVPPQWSRQAVRRLTEIGVRHRHLEYPGRGHDSTMINEAFPIIVDWLRDKTRTEQPAEVTLRAFTPRRGQSHWLSMRETARSPRPATLYGWVTAQRGIEITTADLTAFTLDPARAPINAEAALPLVIDGQKMTAPPPDAGHVLLLRREADQWALDTIARDDAELPAPTVMQLRAPITDVLDRIATLITAATDTEAALIPSDFVAPALPAGDVTADDILDLFFRCEDTLHVATLSAETLAALRERSTAPEWWGTLAIVPAPDLSDPAREMRVVCPAILAEPLPGAWEATDLRLREVIFDHVSQKGDL